MFRGRYPLGDEIALGLRTVDASGAPGVPTNAPSADIWLAGVKIKRVTLPPVDRAAVTGFFQRRVRLGNDFSLGVYQVVYLYTIGSFQGVALDSFEVIGGGHADGAVLSLYGYLRPFATFLVQQLDSGTLVRGKNPRV